MLLSSEEGTELLRLGENGHAEYSEAGLGDSLLALFDKLVRGLEKEKLKGLIENVVNDASMKSDVSMLTNLFVMAFQTRYCRGGKGEKAIFYDFMHILYEMYPFLVVNVLELIPEFGYWKDLLALAVTCKDNAEYPLSRKVFELFAQQIEKDYLEVQKAETDDRTAKISLCAKFCPSEGGKYSKLLSADKEICKQLYPSIVGHDADQSTWNYARTMYRKTLSLLRKKLDITETKMCSDGWMEIDFAHVPSLCMDRNKRAFLNETKGGDVSHPENPTRIACRERLMNHIVENGELALKGKQLFPHELVKQAQGRITPAVSAILDIQWVAVRDGLLQMVADRKTQLEGGAVGAKLHKEAEVLCGAALLCPDVPELLVARDLALKKTGPTQGGLARIVPMSDVSGSMMGTPLLVSIALGILASEVTHPTFRDKVLTFDETPSWHDLSCETSFVDKVSSLSNAPWGGSTDFYAAMKLVADLVRQDKLEQAEIPDLLVISDMQFDEASYQHEECKRWESAYARIKRLFASLGLEMNGIPFHAPKIIFWNVRSDTVGYPATSTQEGVVMLSGFSPSLMKFVLSGEMDEEIVVGIDNDGNVVREKIQVNPLQTLHKVLHDENLDPVRNKINSLGHHHFSI